MATSLLAMYILSAALIVLGFIALLAQKIYIDPSTNEPVSVSIPTLGKVKTNYPALLFVLGGIFLAWHVFEKSTNETTTVFVSVF